MLSSPVMQNFVEVAAVDEIPEGGAKIVQAQGREVALFRLGDRIVALDNECPHRGGPIGEGRIHDGRVTCPWHEWTFDIATGVCTLNPAARLRQYPVRIDGTRVAVAVP